MFEDRLNKIEKLQSRDAVGRILAQDIMADRDEPPTNVSPIDGVALRFVDRHNALWNVGSIELGMNPSDTLSKNECLNVKEGAKLPQNADIICLHDDSNAKDGQVTIESSRLFKVVKQGSIYKKDDMLLTEGQIIDPNSIVTLVKNNILQVSVYAKLAIQIKIHSTFVYTDNFNIVDYKVRDYFTPYIKSSLSNRYKFFDKDSDIDIVIKVVSNLECTTEVLYKGDGFFVVVKNTTLNVTCLCNYLSIQSLVVWLNDQTFI
ncbi:MAG: hypothetical protein KC646_04835 [Candidatus Cloacimonetes bacterium]|nr:hypothetical protein [Candidatus Cloacimonadota bacterium]